MPRCTGAGDEHSSSGRHAAGGRGRPARVEVIRRDVPALRVLLEGLVVPPVAAGRARRSASENDLEAPIAARASVGGARPSSWHEHMFASATDEADWGARNRTRSSRTKTARAAKYTTPQGRAATARYYDLRVPAPTVVILAAGEGTRMRSVRPQGPAPAVRAAADRAGRSPPPARPAPAASWSSTGPKRRARRAPARGRRARDPGGAARAPATRCGPPPSTSAPTTRGRPLRRRPADHRRGDRRARRAPTRRAAPRPRWRRWCSTTRRLRPRRPRRRRQRSSASWRRRRAGDATPEELAIREVNTGIFAFDGGDLLERARRARRPTTPRASTTCPTCCRSCARDGKRGRRATSSTTRR